VTENPPPTDPADAPKKSHKKKKIHPGWKNLELGRTGGARKGAGRPKGATNKLIIANIRRAKKSGILPLDLMLAEMHLHYGIAVKERAKGKNANQALIKEASTAARECAKDAAPYLHPKLASIQHSGNVHLTHEQALKELAGERRP